ncbi:hypothetical protein ACFL0M_02775 [Thermodesulfobacteriota bacterium]
MPNTQIAVLMKLRYDPFQVFRFNKTPAGLYARQKWLGEAKTPQWQRDFQESVSALWADQLPDGSWQHELLATILHLFGLHLTVRTSSQQIENALIWLLEKIDLQTDAINVSSETDVGKVNLKGLPFVSSRPAMLLTGATLFLSTIFGLQNDPAVFSLYQWLSNEGIKSKGLWFDRASSHNIFRAMVVHPVFAKDRSTALAVECLSGLQTVNGDWGYTLPFYQTLNALAHLESPRAEIQLERAFAHLIEIQNSDGTWGRRDPVWNTFLSVHALKNKGIL